MAGLRQATLHAILQNALPKSTVFKDDESVHPGEATIPGVGDARFYLWTLTQGRFKSRSPGECKIEPTFPGQKRDQPGHLIIDNKPTLLLGFSPDYQVFAGWQAKLHRKIAFSSTIQVNAAILNDARRTGWSVAPIRAAEAGPEVCVAFSPANLRRYVKLTKEADAVGESGLYGPNREAFFLVKTPNQRRTTSLAPDPGDDVPAYIEKLRAKHLVSRLARDSRFGKRINEQYSFACAICNIQLGIVEGAHIIPVNDPGGSDQVWNGLALCPNHHLLFDARAFHVTTDFKVKLNQNAIALLRASARLAGLRATLEVFDNKRVKRPLFFDSRPSHAKKMIEALQKRLESAKVQPPE